MEDSNAGSKAFCNSFLRITQCTFPMLLCAVQVQSYYSCAQTTFNDLLYYSEKFGLDTFCRILVMEDSNNGSKAFSDSFLRITQSTFPMLLCSVQVQSNFSCAQTTFNGLLYHR